VLDTLPHQAPEKHPGPETEHRIVILWRIPFSFLLHLKEMKTSLLFTQCHTQRPSCTSSRAAAVATWPHLSLGEISPYEPMTAKAPRRGTH